MNRHQRQACQEIVRVADHVEPDLAAETALALFVMQEQAPRRFLSDVAFWHQLARRVRGLTDVNAGTWFDVNTGKLKRVYRDLPAKTTLTVGKALAEAFGTAGLMLARKETEDAEMQRKDNEMLAKAVGDLL